MKTNYTVLILVVVVAAFAAWFWFGRGDLGRSGANPTIILHTSKGDIAIELFRDKTPITAGNFLKLAREGFYDNTKFHRVIAGFMIQGGDPNSRGEDASLYGRGGPGYTIKDEFAPGLSNARGTISMANTGTPNSGGSQFFINVVDNLGLDFDKPPASAHAVFGRVVSGMEVADEIASAQTNELDMPLEPIVIKNTSDRDPRRED